MIIGHGDIAKAIQDRNEFTFFASGVSNSLCTNESEFKRERDLLLSTHRCNTLVYFSTLSIYTKSSPYTKHKLEMEKLVRKFPHYYIIRIGNIQWGNNPHTFVNFFLRKIKQGKRIRVKNETKYMLSKKEFQYFMQTLVPKKRMEINLMGTPTTPKKVLKQLKLKHAKRSNQPR